MGTMRVYRLLKLKEATDRVMDMIESVQVLEDLVADLEDAEALALPDKELNRVTDGMMEFESCLRTLEMVLLRTANAGYNWLKEQERMA